MAVTVRYFARVREALGREAETLDVSGKSCSVAVLLETLRRRDPDGWGRLPADGRLLFSVNRDLVGPDAQLADGDEVGIFPPVTGG